MTTRTIQNSSYNTSGRTEKMQDFLMLSSFGLWAALLGLSPVVALHWLLGS
jgi:hypothetical protein